MPKRDFTSQVWLFKCIVMNAYIKISSIQCNYHQVIRYTSCLCYNRIYFKCLAIQFRIPGSHPYVVSRLYQTQKLNNLHGLSTTLQAIAAVHQLFCTMHFSHWVFSAYYTLTTFNESVFWVPKLNNEFFPYALLASCGVAIA